MQNNNLDISPWSGTFTSALLPNYFLGMDMARNVSSSLEQELRRCFNPDLKPVRIVSIDNHTIKCDFKDEKEIFVTVQKPDIFDERVGVALAVCTKMFGSRTKFYDYIAEIIERPKPPEKKIKKKAKK